MKEKNDSQSLPLIMEENGKRYRMLQVGETIEIGDECFMVEKWTPLTGWSFGCVIAGELSEGYPQGYYRRPITDHPANDPVNVAAAILEAGK